MPESHNLLTSCLTHPQTAMDLNPTQWDLLVRQARNSNLLPRLAVLLHDTQFFSHAPAPAQRHLDSAKMMAEAQARSIRWEACYIARIFSELDIPVVALKGGAYILGGLPAGRGRIFQDLDIMVPEKHLGKVEHALLMNGWVYSKKDDYDQHYYRQWMHELPPMRHIKRKTSLDVHHTILPLTGPLSPDPEKLFRAAVELPDYPGIQILSPVDIILHSAVHLFHDGELENGFRDLLDLDSLIRDFCRTEDFWNRLIARGRELGLSRPLFYALFYCRKILKSPVPNGILSRQAAGRPNPLLFFWMHLLFSGALIPNHPSCRKLLTRPASFSLYIRGHRLRMPLRLLIPHLLKKSMKKTKER